MWIPWIFTALVVALMVGPIMMIRLSPSQQKQAKLRTMAAMMGLIVRVKSKGETPKLQGGVIYTLPLQQSASKRRPLWWMEKGSYSHGIHFHNAWDWVGQNRAEPLDWPAIRQVIDSLPEGVSGLGLDGAGIFFQWDEKLLGMSAEAALKSLKETLESTAKKIPA
ncbi:MAG: hypothetical protein ACI9Y1_003120 [Lentisphaeria bacterium]|jgi:hypothetical protein